MVGWLIAWLAIEALLVAGQRAVRLEHSGEQWKEVIVIILRQDDDIWQRANAAHHSVIVAHIFRALFKSFKFCSSDSFEVDATQYLRFWVRNCKN